MCFVPEEIPLCVRGMCFFAAERSTVSVCHCECVCLFSTQEVPDQAAVSGVWHPGLHDTGQDCKAGTYAGLDHYQGTHKKGAL